MLVVDAWRQPGLPQLQLAVSGQLSLREIAERVCNHWMRVGPHLSVALERTDPYPAQRTLGCSTLSGGGLQELDRHFGWQGRAGSLPQHRIEQTGAIQSALAGKSTLQQRNRGVGDRRVIQDGVAGAGTSA